MRRTTVFWGLLLIGLGVLFLARRSGRWKDVGAAPLILIVIGLWLLFQRVWFRGPWFRRGLILPLVLLAIGVELLLRDLGTISHHSPIWPVVLIAIGVGLLLGSAPWPGSSRWARGALSTSSEAIPLEGARSARLVIRHGAGRLSVGAGAAADQLLSGKLTGRFDREVRRGDGNVEASYRQRWSGGHSRGWEGGFGRSEWRFELARGIPLSLEVQTGASSASLDLRDLTVTDLSLEVGASDSDLILPAKGQTSARVRAGAAHLAVTVPPGVAARIRTRRGLATVSVDESRFPRTADGFASPDFDTATDRMDLDVEAGAADVRVS